MRGRRLAIPLIVIGSVAVGGVAGAVLGVPSLSGASNGATTVSPVSVPSAGAHCGAAPDAVANTPMSAHALKTTATR